MYYKLSPELRQISDSFYKLTITAPVIIYILGHVCVYSAIHRLSHKTVLSTFGTSLSVPMLGTTLYCIAFSVFIHLYSASHSLSLTEALPTTALILCRS